MSNSNRPRILLQVSASVAAFKAVALCSKLVQANFEVEVILSQDAHYFVGPASFEGLTGKKVHQGNFEEGSMMAHIKLERWADLILLYPASANTIASLALGMSQSLIGSVFLAHEFKKPYWVVPAMNQAMIAHPATQANLAKLSEWKIEVLPADSGALACGEVGAGRLIEPESMLEKIQNYFKTNLEWQKEPRPKLDLKKHKILITAGGTTEPIDTVRSLSNFSTGQTGFALAQAFRARGHDVILLQAQSSAHRFGPFETVTYHTTEEFSGHLKALLELHDFDVVIHAAAVADYSVEAVLTPDGTRVTTTAKIQGDTPLLLKLKPNPKILKSVREWSKNKSVTLISFKLTSGEGSNLKLDTYDSDFVIHNELAAVQGTKHAGEIYARNANKHFEKINTFQTKNELAEILIHLIEEPKA